MRIRNRLPDIKRMLTEILQGFFELEVNRLFPDQDWKEKVMQTVDSGYSYAKSRYAGAYERIQQFGLENYVIRDMDATIILAILEDWDHVYSRRGRSVNYALETLRYDRNADGHLSGSESDSRLRELAFGILHDLRRFLSCVVKDGAYSQGSQEFSERWLPKIDDQQRCLDEDYADVIREEECLTGMNRDIVDILSSRDPITAWTRVLTEKYLNSTYLRDGTYKRFLLTAANSKIKLAYQALADYYFHGLLGYGIEPDYEKAAKCYQQMIEDQTLGIKDKLNLASIYINGLAEGHTVEEGQQLLESCKTPFTTYEVAAYTFYRPLPSKPRFISES